MWLAIGLTLLCFGMALFPLLKLVPNHRQKEMMKIRQAALAQGFNVDIRTPEIDSALKSQYDLTGQVVYRLQAEDINTRYVLALRSNNTGEWFWVNDKRPPAAVMEKLTLIYQDLPKKIIAVEHSQAGTGVCFDERGEPAQLTPLKATLNKLNHVFI
ncbi:MAG: hypothetical protein KAG18_07400 [Sinobacterium sp.]|nr:hypothetical protein [Sinobacterium sp.]